jgi:hypothetical protein
MIFTLLSPWLTGAAPEFRWPRNQAEARERRCRTVDYPVSSQSALTLVRPGAIFFASRHKYRARQIWFALP